MEIMSFCILRAGQRNTEKLSDPNYFLDISNILKFPMKKHSEREFDPVLYDSPTDGKPNFKPKIFKTQRNDFDKDNPLSHDSIADYEGYVLLL